MRAGVAAADITPAPGPVLQGHYSTTPSHAVLFPLETRGIVFEQDGEFAAIASLDVIGLESESVARIRAQVHAACGIPPERIMVACSHTHCGPATLPALGMTPPAEFLSDVEAKSAQVIIDAAANLEPVTLGPGCGSAHFNISRRPLPGNGAMMPNYGGLVDRRVRLLRVDRTNGQPLAVLFHYSCHPTTKAGSEGIISPDYPGVARSFIESQMGCRALYLAGCCGNVRPAVLTPQNTFASATPEQLEACGRELGSAVLAAAEFTRTSDAYVVSGAVLPFEMPFGETLAREQLETWAADDSERGRNLTGPWAKSVLALLDGDGLPQGEPTEMQTLRIGPLCLVAIPGEPVQEIGHAIEKRCHGALGATVIWPVGYANDLVGYLVTEQMRSEGGYEPQAFPYYGRPAAWRNEEQVLVDVAAELLGCG